MNKQATTVMLGLLALLALATPAQATFVGMKDLYEQGQDPEERWQCSDYSDYCGEGDGDPCYPESGHEEPDDSCLERKYCRTHPDAYACTGDTQECEDGFYGWDTDHDGVCDSDDEDDDNDGVPDDCDRERNPEEPNRTIDNVYWTVVGRGACA